MCCSRQCFLFCSHVTVPNFILAILQYRAQCYHTIDDYICMYESQLVVEQKVLSLNMRFVIVVT